ncbi:hypothetical protein D9M69_538170 [compost metagenome]
MVVGALQQREALLESARMRVLLRRQALVPFPRHHGPVAPCGEAFREGRDFRPQVTFVAWLALLIRRHPFGHRAKAGAVIVRSREQHRARRRTGRRGVEAGEADAFLGDAVEMRSLYLASECPEVGIGQVVGDDEQEVRLPGAVLCHCRDGGAGKQHRHDKSLPPGCESGCKDVVHQFPLYRVWHVGHAIVRCRSPRADDLPRDFSG